MARFRCIVRGENFPGALIGRKGREEIVEVAVPSVRRRRSTGFTFYAQGT